MLSSYVPLRGDALWSHIAYGNYIIQNRELPTPDPEMPLAAGMAVSDSSWLSQVILSSIDAHGGTEWLSNTFGIAVLLLSLLLARTLYLQSPNVLVSALGVIASLAIGWSHLSAFGPVTIGMLCFACLLWLLARHEARASKTSDKLGASLWIFVPLLMAAWANLHESYVFGIVVVLCYTLQRVVYVAFKFRTVWATISDRSIWQWVLLLDLATAATILNPLGIDPLLQTTWLSGNQNLRDLAEFQPLVLLQRGGREFALSVLALLLVVRFSKRRIDLAHAMILGLCTLMVVFQVRMLPWYGVVFGLFVTPHVAELARLVPRRNPEKKRIRSAVVDSQSSPSPVPPGRSFKYTLVCCLLIWIAFSFSPLSRLLFGGDARQPHQVYGKANPYNLTRNYLIKNPPHGMTHCPVEWSSWLLRDGPSKLQVFATTNVNLLPRRVWQDYKLISAGLPGWQRALERYQVTCIIVDRDRQRILAGALRSHEEWESRYQDDQAEVFVRHFSTPRKQDPE